MSDPQQKTLDEILARLDRDVPLPRDLWPRITRDISRRPRHLHTFAIAASLILCCAGGLLWVLLGGVNGGSGAMQPNPRTGEPRAAGPRTAGFDEPRNPAYLAARAEIEKSFRDRLAVLDPATRTKIEGSLAQIRLAHEQLRQALDAQPANPVLEHLLQSTLQDEFDLYDNVVRATQPTFLRS